MTEPSSQKETPPTANGKVNMVAVLRAKGLALKTMLATVEDKEKFPSMLLAESLNQLSAETAKAMPEIANIMPGPVAPLPDNHDFSGETYFTLLTLTETVVAVLNEMVPPRNPSP